MLKIANPNIGDLFDVTDTHGYVRKEWVPPFTEDLEGIRNVIRLVRSEFPTKNVLIGEWGVWSNGPITGQPIWRHTTEADLQRLQAPGGGRSSAGGWSQPSAPVPAAGSSRTEPLRRAARAGRAPCCGPAPKPPGGPGGATTLLHGELGDSALDCDTCYMPMHSLKNGRQAAKRSPVRRFGITILSVAGRSGRSAHCS